MGIINGTVSVVLVFFILFGCSLPIGSGMSEAVKNQTKTEITTETKAETEHELESTHEARMFLTVKRCDEGQSEVSLCYFGDVGICALSAEITYDGEELILLSCGAEDEKIKLTHVDTGGSVRFLLDSTENTAKECVLARFFFTSATGRGGELELSGYGEICALCFGDDGEPVSVSVCFFGGEIAMDERVVIKEDLPRIISYKTYEDGDGRCIISFTVQAKDNFFAAGVRLFTVGLEDGGCGDVRIVGVVGEDGVFEAEYSFEAAKNIAVSMTAVGYERDGEIRGERRCSVISLQRSDTEK